MTSIDEFLDDDAPLVLVVDDQETVRFLASSTLQEAGFRVKEAESGIQALADIESSMPDLVLLDVMMPQMDGIETLKRLLVDNPELQVILLTGCATLEKGIEAIKLGAMDFLEKPAEIQMLMEQIEQAKANKMLLVEKRLEEKIKGIMHTKGW